MSWQPQENNYGLTNNHLLGLTRSDTCRLLHHADLDVGTTSQLTRYSRVVHHHRLEDSETNLVT